MAVPKTVVQRCIRTTTSGKKFIKTVMDKATQLEELDSLKSIYYNEEFQVLEDPEKKDKIQAIFWAFFTLPDNYTVKYLSDLDSSEPSYLKVKHLPPIELRLTLPEDYPSKQPPDFVISCQWLPKSKIRLLCKKLDDIWLEYGSVEIIYAWCDFLKNDSLSFLGYENELDLRDLCSKHLNFIRKLESKEEKRNKWKEMNGCRLKEKFNLKPLQNAQDNPKENVEEFFLNGNEPPKASVNMKVDSSRGGFNISPSRSQRKHQYLRRSKFKNKSPKKGFNKFDERAVLNLGLKTSPIKVLENYNTEREKVEFLRNVYTCNICFSDKLGKDCTQFKECKHIFCVNCIRSYFTVRIIDGTVQSIKCPEEKCTAEALPSQVKEIVTEELFTKYDSVLLSTALDTLGDIIYCPRQICQYPVSWDPEEKMASCPNCQFVFCVTCKMVYHGIEPCQIKTGVVQKLVEQYENASEEVRQQLESRYGKKHLESLVNNSKAEAWIKENSKSCPRCEVAIEKSQGCNKMVCWKCNASFCWLCSEILDPKNPYLHFSDPQSRCVNKLFHLVHVLEEDEEDDWDWVDDSGDDFSNSDIDEGDDEYIYMLEDIYYF